MEQATGEKERRFMKKKIKYTKGEIGDYEIIDDFLPSPEHLVFKKQNIKITIALTQESVDFFKKQAAIHHTPYQKMIKDLLDQYTVRHKYIKSGSH